MYVVVQHELTDPPEALARGERLKRGEGAPAGARALQFYPTLRRRGRRCVRRRTQRAPAPPGRRRVAARAYPPPA